MKKFLIVLFSIFLIICLFIAVVYHESYQDMKDNNQYIIFSLEKYMDNLSTVEFQSFSFSSFLKSSFVFDGAEADSNTVYSFIISNVTSTNLSSKLWDLRSSIAHFVLDGTVLPVDVGGYVFTPVAVGEGEFVYNNNGALFWVDSNDTITYENVIFSVSFTGELSFLDGVHSFIGFIGSTIHSVYDLIVKLNPLNGVDVIVLEDYFEVN